MELKVECFEYLPDLITYVNMQKIQREDIQEIFKGEKYFCLLYWAKEKSHD